MSVELPGGESTAVLEDVYRSESRRVLATLIRLLGDFDLAEDALQEAFAAAAKQWPRDGVPSNPRAWLVSTGRFKAIDALRRNKRSDTSIDALADWLEAGQDESVNPDEVADDQLRLIFTCCHPILPADARVALTLREVCGLTTEEIARAFLTSPPTLAQRIVRAKARIRDADIPFEVPSAGELPARLDAVLQVVYLVFNEGYSAAFGESLTRPDLSGEAIRLGRLLLDLLPEPEAAGLLALMLLQDRSLWNRDQILEGVALAQRALRESALRSPPVRSGYYTLQAAIAAAHGRASSVAETDWGEIVRLYDLLAQAFASPVIELNRAVAVAMRDGPEAGLALVDDILAAGDLRSYHLAYAARADLCRRLGRTTEARSAYQQALALAGQEAERRYLERRLVELGDRVG